MQVVIGIALVLAAASVDGAGPLDTPGAMKALNCSACHGFAGQSAGDTMPILAGLWPEYFKKAIADYASGKRPSTEMEPYAKQVIQFGVDDYAVYFGGLKREPTKIAVDAELDHLLGVRLHLRRRPLAGRVVGDGLLEVLRPQPGQDRHGVAGALAGEAVAGRAVERFHGAGGVERAGAGDGRRSQ